MDEILSSIKEMGELNTLVCLGGFIIGLLYGWWAEISRFCLRASVAEWTLDNRQDNPVRSAEYVTAMVTSILGVQLLMLTTQIDFDQSIYRAQPFRPLAYIAGGALFGVGMVLAGGCVSRMLILGASGNLRSLYTLVVIAIAGYATNRGILAFPRLSLEGAAEYTGSVQTVDGLFGVSPAIAAVIVLVPLGALLVFLLMRSGVRPLLSGIGIGALVTVGWWLTGVFGADEFEPRPLQSLTYTAPVGDALQYLMTFTGSTMTFGIAVIGGILCGALVSSLVSGRFAITGFQYPSAPLRYALGGLLMGFGGVTGLGCPMGQGITGTGTLATGSFLLIASIVVSAALTYKLYGPMPSGAPAKA